MPHRPRLAPRPALLTWITVLFCDTLVLVRPAILAAAVLAGQLACGGPGTGQQPWTSTSGTTSLVSGSTSSSSGSSEDSTGTSTGTSTSTSTSTSSTGAETTVSPPPDMPNFDTIGPVPEGCKKIDLLFVLRDPGSSDPFEQAAARAFADADAARMIGLADAITAEAKNYDLHVMVTTITPDFTTTADNLCGASCDPIKMPCDVVPEHVCMQSWEDCDWALGSGVNFPRGTGASNKLCPTTEGRRYARSQDPQFHEAVDCLLHVGRSGTGKGYVALTPMAALKPGMVADGGCNAGFLRDDAMLVVVIVAITAGGSDTGTPMEWAQNLLAIKGGYEDGVVLVMLTDGVPPEPECGDFSSKLRTFGELVPNHVLGCDTAPDFTPFVTAAVDKIDAVCDQFVPPG